MDRDSFGGKVGEVLGLWSEWSGWYEVLREFWVWVWFGIGLIHDVDMEMT
jgi:hypothetical protein